MTHYTQPDDFVHTHSFTHKTAVDELEPVLSISDQLHETRLRSLTLLNNVMAALGEVLARKNVTLKEVAACYWQVCFALGLPVCAGRSLTEVANRLGLERATISKGAVLFCESNSLPSNQYLKCESARLAYREARIAVVIASANGNRAEHP